MALVALPPEAPRLWVLSTDSWVLLPTPLVAVSQTLHLISLHDEMHVDLFESSLTLSVPVVGGVAGPLVGTTTGLAGGLLGGLTGGLKQ